MQGLIGQVLEKLAYDKVGVIEPRRRVVDAFTRHCEGYFERTVYADECDSWYKSSPVGAPREERRRGWVTAIWPGSSLHAVRALRCVRWEDFDMTAYDGNGFGWFGNRLTVAEKDPSTEDRDAFTW